MTVIEDQARSVFLAALERAPEQWSAFLNQACGDNAELLARVDQLLRAHEAMGSIHGGGADAAEAISSELRITEGPGADIGPYKLVEQIGEGGMGIVFLAEQQRPVQRRVAVKIIKPGMDSRQVIARFEAERQAMALMEHANIAKVLDAGTTESGRPYFVMELVHGVPITDYCDQCNLTTRERLELFVELCQAVQHAHQKGVIHRDIKPTNVLVAIENGQPAPKIIDFGVAKAINQRLTEHTLVTSFAQMVGTPLYMSPEQAELSRLGVDTRSDVYSLGVLLYELLTGTTPFDKERLHTAPYDEVRRIIREEEPPWPSSRISTLAADLATTVASQRRTDPRRLMQTVRGELDWIVMKTLEKDRNRRYESVNNFAADVERFLNDETVEACPPSTVYRLRKFVRRNRGPVAAAAALLLMLCLGLTGTSVGLYRARVAENRASLEASNALESEKKATQEASNFRRLNFRMAFDRGLTLCDQGHVGRGMLWLARALELAPAEEADIRRVILANLNAWRRELHSLEAIFPHSKGVINAAISPNGKLVLTASKDQTAQLWNTATGKRIGKSMQHAADVHEAVFSGDGSHILTANYDQTARLWETESREQIHVFAHQANVAAAAFSPDGLRIVTGGHERRVRIWDASSGAQLDELPRQHFNNMIHDLVISVDGSKILTACHDKNVRIWDFDTRELIATFKHDARVPTADFTRDDGSRIVTADSDGNVFLWDVAAAVTNNDHKLETAAMEYIKRWRHRGGVHRLRASRDLSRILTGSFDNTAQLLDSVTLAPIGVPLEHQATVWGGAFNPDGSLIVTACEDNAARLWRPAVGQSPGIKSFECHGDHEAVFTSDGLHILTKTDENTALVRETTTGTRIVSFPQPGAIRAVAVSPDGSKILTGNDTSAQLWDPSAGEPMFPPFEHAGGVWAMAFSADGEQMVTGGFRGTVQLRDVGTAALIGEPAELGTRVWGASFSPDGSRFAVACGDKVVRLFDERLGNIPRPFARHQDEVVAVAFSPDGTHIATGSRDNTVRVWDASTGRWLSEPMRHKGPIWYPVVVAFSPDGQSVVTGCDDWTVRIWDVDTAKPIGPALVHEAGVRMVAFTGPSQVLTGTSVGTVRVWEASISPMEDDVERITVWLEVVTGMGLDSEGILNTLDAPTWQQRRRRLDQLGGPPLGA